MKTTFDKKIITTVLLSTLLWLATPSNASAQIVFQTDQEAYQNTEKSLGIGNDFDNVNDENPEAPINGLLELGLLLGAYFGYRKLKKDH